MSASFTLQLEISAALLQAFPQLPKPSVQWNARSALEYDVQELLRGHTWLEAVGWILRGCNLSCSLTTWTSALPAEVIAYYLPSHLMFASLALSFKAKSDYPGEVTEALLLPTPDPADNEKLEHELFVCAILECYPERASKIYHALTPAQRACVAKYLEMYRVASAGHVTAAAEPLYAANLARWESSSFTQ